MRVTEIQIGTSATNLHNTIFTFTAFFGITNTYSIRIQTGGILELCVGFTTIFGMVFTNRLNDTIIIVNISLKFTNILIGLSNQFQVSLLLLVCNLRHTNTKVFITFGFQNKQSFFQSSFRASQVIFDIGTNVKDSFSFKLLLNSLSSCASSITISNGVFFNHGSNGRFGFTHNFTNLSRTSYTVIHDGLDSIILKLFPLMISNSNLHSQVGSRQTNAVSNFLLRQALIFEFVNSTQQISATLERCVPRAPGVSSRTSLYAIM